MEEAMFSLNDSRVDEKHSWANYVLGVAAQLNGRIVKADRGRGFVSLFFSSVPLGAGLSSSAALEMSAALALREFYHLEVDNLELARIGQTAENQYAGARTGLLDQISSLYGEEDRLVMSDFRTLEVETVPLGTGIGFLVCNTKVKHALVESDYNARRKSCEAATEFFASCLDRPVSALRDVTYEDWTRLSPEMDPEEAKRAAHIITENGRVQEARRKLEDGALEEFGKLMFESHKSSRENFENSCTELDFLVDKAREHSEVLGARLSGGGFGGSVVVLLDPEDVKPVEKHLVTAFREEFGYPCDSMMIRAAKGAIVL
jgi:galactokinase